MSASSDVTLIKYGDTDTLVAANAEAVSQTIQNKIRNGKYERREAATVPLILEGDDIVLELGSGLGLISTLAYKTGKVKDVHCFEADSRLIPLITLTHKVNGVTASIYNEVLTSDAGLIEQGYVEFHLRRNFYGSSLTSDSGAGVVETVRPKTKSFAEAVAAISPTVIVSDIEGGEAGLFSNCEMPSVRRVMMEIHPTIIGSAGVKAIFDDMHRAGLHYDHTASQREILVFRR